MDSVEVLVKIFLFHLPVLIIPGPNLMLVIKNSMAKGAIDGLITSFGICLGISIHVFYTLLLLSSLSMDFLAKLESIKYLAAIYLLYIALFSFKNSKIININKDINEKKIRYFHSFRDGFLIDCLNPIIGTFYFLMWNSTITNFSLLHSLSYGVFSLLMVLIWFSCVSVIFSSNQFRIIYVKYNIIIERITSLILIMFAITLIK